jgi:hypothetical protein
MSNIAATPKSEPVDIEVWELGENSDAWFAEHAENEADARAAVNSWLDALVGDPEALEEAGEALDAAVAVEGRWWFATSHEEGEMVADMEPPVWRQGFRLAPAGVL